MLGRAVLLAAALMLVSLMPGCLQGDDEADAPSPTGPEQAPAPPALVTPTRLTPVNIGAGVGEPNIAVGRDGTIYAADPGINVWRSTDGAHTFTRMDADGITGGGDGDIVIDDAGCVHWLGLFGSVNGESAPIPYQRSCDGGDRFSEALDLSDGSGSDREWLGRSLGGVLYASWRGGNDSSGANVISATTSFDGGQTWTPLVDMAPDAVGGPIVGGAVEGHVFEAMTTFGQGEVPFNSGVSTDGQEIMLARSFDHGATWSLVPVFHPTQSASVGLIGFATSIFPVVAADDDNTLYVVFSADQRNLPQTVPKPAARFGVFLTVSKDLGDSWSQPILLSDPEKVALMPWVAAGAPGRIAVTWYENTLGNPADVLPDLWNVKLWESLEADQPVPASVTLQLNDMPNHVGAVCTSGTGCLAGDRSLLDFFEVALQPNGHPVVVWSYSAVGTGVGVAADGVDIWVGGVADGTPLR